MSVQIKYGITGNWYCYSSNKALVEEIAKQIGKATSSIKFYDQTSFYTEDAVPNKINKVWVFRTKNKALKKKLKHIKEKIKL